MWRRSLSRDNIVFLSSFFIVLAMILMPDSVTAQTLRFDRADLLATCHSEPKSCELAVLKAIETLKSHGLSPAEFNSQLGALAATIVEAAQTTGAQNLFGLGDAMVAVADASTDLTQASSIRGVVTAISSGNLGSVGLNTPQASAAAFSASEG